MSNNVAINPSAGGAIIHTDDIGSSVQAQVVKIMTGATSVDGGVMTESNPLFVQDARPATGTITSVNATTSSTQLLAANTARKGLIVWNNSTTATLFLAESNITVTSSLATVEIPPGGYWEDPFKYTGIVKGIWDIASGNALLTELS